MQITITGKQIRNGDARRTHTEADLNETVLKYVDKPIEAHVVFSRPGKSKTVRTDISVHAGRGIQFQGHGETDDPYTSCDAAIDRVGKQLRREKRRRRDHRRIAPEEPIDG